MDRGRTHEQRIERTAEGFNYIKLKSFASTKSMHLKTEEKQLTEKGLVLCLYKCMCTYT